MIWYVFYNFLLLLASPVILIILAAKQRCRRGLPERFGWRRSRPGGTGRTGPVIWIHAVSLGEVVAVTPLARKLHERFPRYRLIVTTVTETGREAVEQRLAGVAEHRYAPLDFPWAVRRFLDLWKPSLYLFVETELWPNLLRILERRGIPSILVNGRLSTRSFKRQRMALIGPLYRRMVRSISCCLMQSERDAERMIDLGADPARVRRTGNIKFDQPLPQAAPSARPLSRDSLGIGEHERLFIAGSTHPEEEKQLLTCYQRVSREVPQLVLVLAPRHIERAAQLEATVRATGLPVMRRSMMESGRLEPVSGPRVVILDSRGELAWLYKEAVVAFVGGTFVPVGGHNLLEPAVWGKPVFFGSHTDHCAEVADLLLTAEGGARVRDADELARRITELLLDEARLISMGQAARQVVKDNQGALQASLDQIAAFLPDREVSAGTAAGDLLAIVSSSRS
ncbi:MAG TPA: 3-deoxy-D-manno-octulosonic acid transferase [Nitrospiraceae bacterium]|nr:3-deoxy-D-manno-octulosonic acid transferase [Nitrospiraceae bacterium]